MKRIKFNQLRYVLPLILLPFAAILFAATKDSFSNEKQHDTLSKAEINAELQAPDLEKTQTLNKFDALFSAYEHKEDFSAIKGIETEEDKNMELDDKDLYSMGEMDKINQMNKMEDKLGIPKANSSSNYSLFKNNENAYQMPQNGSMGSYASDYTDYKAKYDGQSKGQSKEFEKYLNTINSSKTESSPKPVQKNRFDEEMALFKAQMSLIDSMTNKTGQKDSNTEEVSKPKTEPLISDIKEVKKAGLNGQSHFNTLGDSRQNSFIKAILDEGLKVYDGSRVRIRLMDDIVVDNTPLSKGSYLFGIISGFATQRVFITITNIVYDNRIINVKLEVYDYDGMKGLYIPESLFREISKEAGAQAVGNGNVTFSNGREINATQLAYQAAQDAYRTSTRAMSDAIRKRKAILKYNTMVYLVNNNEKGRE